MIFWTIGVIRKILTNGANVFLRFIYYNKRQMTKFILFSLSLASLALVTDSCKTSKNQTSEPVKLKLEELAEAQLGSPYDMAMNTTEKYALVSKKLKTRPNDAYPALRFFIYDMKAEESIYQNTEPGGKAEWESDHIVKITSYIGIPNPDESDKGPKTYRFNVITKKKYSGGGMRQPSN
jgi:hypothetical protein